MYYSMCVTCIMQLICIMSLNHVNNPMKYILFFIIYILQRKKLGHKSLSNLFEVNSQVVLN